MRSGETTPDTFTPTGDPWLLTPGPLTTSPEVKQAMLHDFGSRDSEFIEVNRAIRTRLVDIVRGGDAYVCVPVQGSGTFAVEAMMGTLTRPDDKVLVLINGAYGRRIATICEIQGRAVTSLDWPENQPVEVAALEHTLNADPAISHVVAVHCETTTGLLNPIPEIAAAVRAKGRRLLIDSMSAFGALPLDSEEVAFDAVVASSNKCLQGTPGMGFCVVRREVLETCAGNAPSLSLDLHDQWTAMEKNGQWRFTPPVQVIAAFARALDEFDAEGGQPGRYRRYAENCRILIDGMEQLGFKPLLSADLQAPIIVTFLTPADPNYNFETFYDRLRARGYVIYPGKLTVADTFRIGCIGALGPEQIRGALEAIELTLNEMGVADCAAAA